MRWDEDNCDLSALRSALEAQAGNLASLAARIRTAEDNIEQQHCVNKGLKSALVKLASREAVTRSQLYATIERIEADVSDIRAGKNSMTDVLQHKSGTQTQIVNKATIDCKDCQALCRRLELVERQLEDITRNYQLQSSQSKCRPTSKREDCKNNCNQEHTCSVTTDNASEIILRKGCFKENYLNKEIPRNSETGIGACGDKGNASSCVYFLKQLEAVSRQENISPDEFYCQLNFYLKRIYLSTICGRNVSAKLMFDMGRCFFLVENSKVFKKLELHKRNELNLLLKDIFVHFDSILFRMKNAPDKLTMQDKILIPSNESNNTDHCSTSTFEALCAEKQSDYPLQQIFDESNFNGLDENWNDVLSTEAHFNPNQKEYAISKHKTRDKKSFHSFEGKENMKSIALDDSTDLEWQECLRCMNENL